MILIVTPAGDHGSALSLLAVVWEGVGSLCLLTKFLYEASAAFIISYVQADLPKEILIRELEVSPWFKIVSFLLPLQPLQGFPEDFLEGQEAEHFLCSKLHLATFVGMISGICWL